MSEVYASLFSWAMLLSGMQGPMPQVVLVDHEWMMQEACNGRECKVLGFYRGDGRIYLDERLDMDEPVHASIFVHEATHYLRDAKGFYTHGGCAAAIEEERIAYSVQREYLVRQGSLAVIHVGGSVHGMSC